MTVTLPPFPIDDATLDLLTRALDPGIDADRSSLNELLDLYSELAGSDLSAVDEDDELNSDHIRIMRDPAYHANDVITALVAEVRRQRAELAVAA